MRTGDSQVTRSDPSPPREQLELPLQSVPTAASLAPDNLKTSLALPTAPRSSHTTSTGLARRLGNLGIPVPHSDHDDDESDSESVAANPPASPAILDAVAGSPPADSSIDGRKARSAPLPAHERSGSESCGSREGTAWTENGFRGIVDDLTVENQQLRGRLRRFEAAQIPTDLRRDRLFEVRFFEGLPKERRHEIESFLTSYVQQMSSAPPEANTSHIRSRPPASLSVAPPLRHPVDHHSSLNGTGTTSSIGVTLRSLRSSEKERLLVENNGLVGPTEETEEGESRSGGSGSGGERSGARDTALFRSPGSHSGHSVAASGSGSAARRFRSARRKNLEESTMPSSPQRHRRPHSHANENHSALSTTSYTHPPAILRRLPHTFQVERDLLASASFSGPEPESRTGTGTGMRISDPSSKKRRRSSPPLPPPSVRPPLTHRGSSGSERDREREAAASSETLARLVVEMIERLFEESLPLVSPFGSPPPRVPSPPNPLHSEPSPLPAHSHSNTHYLRELLASSDGTSNSWQYLNLLLTFAGVHRLNVSIGFVRHALRTQSALLEVSEEGNKVRWKGPSVRVLKDDHPRRAVGEVEDDVREHEDALMEDAVGLENDRDDDEPPSTTSFKFSSGKTKDTSTAATSVGLTGGSGSKNAASLLSSGARGPFTSSGLTSSGKSARSGSVQDEVPSYELVKSAVDASALGITTPLHPSSPPHLSAYVPLFGKTALPSETSDCGDGRDDEASPDEQPRPPAKKRRVGGGVIFFNSDRFCSDLAGDSGVRERLLKHAAEDGSDGSDSDWPTTRATPSSSRALSPLSLSSSDLNELELDVDVLPVYTCRPLSDEAMVNLPKLPLASLALSGMTPAIPADHFTLIVHTLHSSSISSSSPPLLSLLNSRTVHHLPVAKVRFPRVRLVHNSDDSDDDEDDPAPLRPRVVEIPQMADYATSLNLPLNQWAREPKRSWLDNDDGEGVGGEDEMVLDV